jgi:hypothetical protein
VEFTIDVSKLSVKDMGRIDKAATGEPGAFADALDALAKATSIDLDDIPLTDMKVLFESVIDGISASINPENLD